MEPYATVADLEARWRPLTADEQALAETLLEDASVRLASQIDVKRTDTYYMELLKQVTCAMVRRAMGATEMDLFGVTQSSMTAGPYSEQRTYSNPTGDMYLTKEEKRLLGIGVGYIGSIRVKSHRMEVRYD